MNPLGGTMVADAGGMGFNPYAQPNPYGAPPAPAAPPADPYGPPPGGYGTPGQPGAGYGAPPQGGYGAPPGGSPQGGYGGPPQGGYGGPPAAPQGGYGGPPQGGYGAPGGFTPPQDQYGGYGAGAPIVPAGGPGYGGGGQRGPIGKIRNPIMVLVLGYVTCGIYGIFAFFGMLSELKAFRGKNDINPIFFIIPILSLIEMWKLPEKVLEAKRLAGVPNPQVPNPILYLLLGLYFFPNDLNEVWQAAGGGQLPPAS